jgi:hypothetical protein
VGKSTKKSPMKRRCAIIPCSQNINYINSRSQKPVTVLVPDNKPITIPMYLWIDSRCALEKGEGGISSMLNIVIGLLSGTRAVTDFCDLEYT